MNTIEQSTENGLCLGKHKTHKATIAFIQHRFIVVVRHSALRFIILTQFKIFQ